MAKGRRAAALKAGVVALIVVFILAVLASVAKGRRAAALKAGVVALIVVFILAVLASVAKGRRAAALRQVSSPSSCLIRRYKASTDAP